MMQHRKRTLLVGFDAACWEYLDPLLAQGRLPNVKKLMEGGAFGFLHSTMPPMTPVAWSSIATGKGPSKHGVYEWVRRKAGTYEFRPCTSSDRRGIPFWNTLSSNDIRVGLVNVPFTYPAPPINGFVLSGFGTPNSAKDFAYPTDLRDEIVKSYGSFQADIPETEKIGCDPVTLFEAEQSLQEQQVRIAIAAAEQYDIDVLVINLMFLDHANHYFPDMNHVEEAIACTDMHLGMLLNGYQPDTVLLFSDHGSRRISGRFLLGWWLRDHGYLSWPDDWQLKRLHINSLVNLLLQQRLGWSGLAEKIARRLAVEIWSRLPERAEYPLLRALQGRFPLQSQSFWQSPRLEPRDSKVYLGTHWGCLYVNLEGREPAGLIPTSALRELRRNLATELMQIVDPSTHEPLFSQIYDVEGLYPEGAAGQPPDLILDYHSTCWALTEKVPAAIASREGYFVRDPGDWHGEHSREGIYVFAGAEIAPSSRMGSASLLDIPATLLHLCGLPIPDDYDGQVLTDLLQSNFLSNRPVRYLLSDPSGRSEQGPAYSESEEEEILDRLKSLGYVE